ncbi:MAG: YtxH domain-containing protein [Thermomicrobiales bacterium]|nr:YtxH domain-containing protein [Thermomicrobiales bacterium]MCO5228924.1 YtxH domain-containing protein [Thermomicrobiales bacterium]
MNDGIRGFLKFIVGSAVGVAIGAAAGALAAPKSGEEFQTETNAFLNSVKEEGEAARVAAEAEVAQRFRERVNDPKAFVS